MSSPQGSASGSTEAPPVRVAIVSGSFGAGHDAAAAAITQQLRAAGISSRTWDIVDLMPGRLGRIVRTLGFDRVASIGPWPHFDVTPTTNLPSAVGRMAAAAASRCAAASARALPTSTVAAASSWRSLRSARTCISPGNLRLDWPCQTRSVSLQLKDRITE